jgi:hypothetical protein
LDITGQVEIADAEHFLVRCSRTGAAMGWTALDLFGIHPTRATRFEMEAKYMACPSSDKLRQMAGRFSGGSGSSGLAF